MGDLKVSFGHIHRRRVGAATRFGVVVALTALIASSSLPAQGPPEISDNGVVNAASFRPPDFPGGAVAPGSIVSIFGRGLGPGDPVGNSGLPLPTQLGPQETKVVVNDVERCHLFFVSERQINCQLPHNLLGERVRLRVMTTAGMSEEISIPLAQAGFGLFTMNANGRGPLVAQNFMEDPDPARRFRLNGPDRPAQRRQIIVLWGTGLGPTQPAVQAGQGAAGQTPAVNQPQVFVGNRAAVVQYAGRAPGFAGLDQIQFPIPDDTPFGCAVPVRLQLGTQVSNMGSIAIGPGDGFCRDSVEEVISGLSHGSIVLGSGLGRLGAGQLGPMSGLGGPFGRGNGPGPGGPALTKGMGPGMGFGGGVGPGPGGVGRGGIGPFGLHPGIPPHAGGLGIGTMGSLGPNVVTARFVRLAAEAGMDIGIPPAATDSCTSYFQGPYGNADLFRGAIQLLDAGTLTLAGPGLNLTLFPEPAGAGVLYSSALPGPLEQGDYSVAGAGGADVGAFGPAELDIPSLLDVTTNLAPGTVVSRAAGLQLVWVGGNADDIVVIHGRSFHIPPGTEAPIRDPMQFRSQAFLCNTSAGNGAFTVPEYVLNALPDGLLNLQVTHLPSADGVARFDAPGLDLGGVFRWLDTTAYLDLVLEP